MNAFGRITVAFAAASALAVSAQGANVLLNDQFTDLGRTNGADAHDSQWYVYANAVPTISAASGKLVGTSGNSSTGFNPGFVTNFASTTLATGDTITLSFDFSSLGAAGAANVRFGLYNSGGTNMTADIGVNGQTAGTGAIFQNDTGYSVFAPHRQTGTVQLYSRPANSTDKTLPIAAGANAAIAGASAALGTATNETDTFSASLSLTRTLTGYDYAVTYASASFTGSTTTVTGDTFDMINIWGLNAQQLSFTLDNVSVSVVPEPTALGLLGLAALALPRRRRH